VVETLSHSPVGRCWDIEALAALCLRARELARRESATVGIDSWGVDLVAIEPDGTAHPPVCYRDPSHEKAFQSMPHYRLGAFPSTGVADQPFNTVYQLRARADEDPGLPGRATWLLLPDYLALRLGAAPNYEATIASTTQMVGIDGRWHPAAFEACGWPVPDLQPCLGGLADAQGVPLVRVPGHDTACAVLALTGGRGGVYANAGTWTLVGTVVDRPALGEEVRQAGWTNERNWDGRFRLLKNVPGFYIANRLREELAPTAAPKDWAEPEPTEQVFDSHDPRLFNPESMAAAVRQVLGSEPGGAAGYASVALESHAAAVARALDELDGFQLCEAGEVVLGGGGAKSAAFVSALRRRSGRPIRVGPHDATLEGNLLAQFRAQGAEVG
jgi:rhamnulokinase